MTSQQYEQAQAMVRIERKVKSGCVLYVGSAADMLAAGVIGPHMIGGPRDGMLIFRYGVKWSGDLDAGGVCTVFHAGSKLAAFWWAKPGDSSPDLESARPCWRPDRQANVVQLPVAAPAGGRRRRLRPRSAPASAMVSVRHLRLVWSAPAQ